MSRRKPTRKNRMRRAAKRLPSYLQDIVFTKATGRAKRDLGKYGAASPVRRISPETGEVIEEI